MGEKIKAKNRVIEISTVSLVKDGIMEGGVDAEGNTRGINMNKI